MTTIRRESIDSDSEKRILTGFIVSKRFLQEMLPKTDWGYFKNEYIQRVCKWCAGFYKDYNKAPYKDISEVLKKNQFHLKPEEEEIITALLINISERFELVDDFNVDLYVDEAIRYYKKRDLEIRVENTQILLERNEIDKAEDQFVNYKEVARSLSNWYSPFTDEMFKSVFEEKKHTFFRFPGKLGEFLGDHERGWCVGISGRFKGGKSFFSLEYAIAGILHNLRVAFVSLEMFNRNELNGRIFKRLFPSGDIDGGYEYPCFDCARNQADTCQRTERINRYRLLTSDNKKPKFRKDNPYRACTACRNKKGSDYELETWKEIIEKPEFSYANAINTLRAYQDTLENRLRIITYPRFSASVEDIDRDLDVLKYTEDFDADMIIVDYADIVKVEGVYGVEKEDIVWMSLARMADTRHALLISPTQVVKDALDAENITQKHTSKWIGKLGHVNVMLAINQTDKEKDMGVMRISKMLHREQKFLQKETVTILQQLDLGQVHLDSEY